MNYDGPRTLVNSCWCGSANLAPFATRYVACQVCGTLILSPRPPDSFYEVRHEDADFYGEQYWMRHQQEAHSLPDIYVRAKNDLTDRCIYWLEHLLKYVGPPSQVLEIGCAHGGFIYLLQQAGFEAVGLELSHWVATFGRKHFGVDVKSGTLADAFPGDRFNVICMFDVLEHFLDPVGALTAVRERLEPNGILFVQTPCYRDEGSGWSMLVDPEHTYLFNRLSVERLFRACGFNSLAWLPELFPTDMFFVAGLGTELPPRLSDEGLTTKPIVEALLTLGAAKRMLVARFHEAETDRSARLEAIKRLEQEIHQRETSRQQCEASRQQCEASRQQCEASRQQCEASLHQLENSPLLLAKKLVVQCARMLRESTTNRS
jgi:2-polyprenyl-3-methyl-5-hydroxy-6-metoxy-1,4-benzoquinol methylase